MVSEWLGRPTAAQHRQRLIEHLCASAALDTERLLLVRVGHAQPEGREQPTVREAIECGQLLRQHDRVATGQHHDAHAELQPLRAAGSERHRHQRVGRVAADALAEPQAVEAQGLQRVDHFREAAVVELGAHPEPEPDANLHDAAMPCRMAAVSAMRETNGEWSVSSVCTVLHRWAIASWWLMWMAWSRKQRT